MSDTLKERVSVLAASLEDLLQTETKLRQQYDTMNRDLERAVRLGEADIANEDENAMVKKKVELYVEKDRLEFEITDARERVVSIMERRAGAETQLAQNDAAINDTKARTVQADTESHEIEDRIRVLSQETVDYGTMLMQCGVRIEAAAERIMKNEDLISRSKAFLKNHEGVVLHRPFTRLIVSQPLGTPTALAFAPKYDSLFVATEQKSLANFLLPNLQSVSGWTFGAVANAVVISDELAALPSSDQRTRLMRLDTGRIIFELTSHTDAVHDACWVSSGQLVTTSKDRTFKLFDVNQNKLIRTWSILAPGNSLASTINRQVVVIGCGDGTLRVVDTRLTGVAMKVEHVHSRGITGVAQLPTEESVFTVGLDDTLCEVSLRASAAARRVSWPDLQIKHPLSRVGVDPTGGFVAVGSQTGAIIEVDVVDETRAPIVLNFHEAPVWHVAFSANMLVTADRKGQFGFWGWGSAA